MRGQKITSSCIGQPKASAFLCESLCSIFAQKIRYFCLPMSKTLYGFMKKLLIILVLLSGSSSADSWGPGLIKFSLEGSVKSEAMLWLSGFSYSATAFYQRCGGLEKPKNIGSKHLIEILNREYAGKVITSEQAASTLDDALSKKYLCGAI